MDIGIFKASGGRLKAWLMVPPLLMVCIGLGSYAWQQRAEWQLQETTALSEVLPSFITARKEALSVLGGFNASEGGDMASSDQLISFLQDMAQQTDFMVDTVNMVDRKNQVQKAVPVLNAVVRGTGDFMAAEVYINKVKTKQRLLSVDSIEVSQPGERSARGLYEVEIVFELLLLDEMTALNGGVQ